MYLFFVQSVNQDYNFTDASVSPMEINETSNQLDPISFSIGSTFVDNLLEGAEQFSIRLSQSGILQVGDGSSVNVRILDNTRKNNIKVYHFLM